MTVRVELEHALEARIAAEARARGLEVERYLRELVISALPDAPRNLSPDGSTPLPPQVLVEA